jgi:hypothetical protein
MTRSVARRVWGIAAAISFVVGAAQASPAWALAVSQAYLFSDWSSPSVATGAPFSFTPTAGYQLMLNTSRVASSATLLSGLPSLEVTNRLYYQSHSGTIDPGEVSSSQLANRVNNEIAALDDAGLVNESVDAHLNIDFTNDSSVMLRTALGVTTPGLVIFEDAGLDPFSLRYCRNLSCTDYDLLFNGFTSSTRSTLLSSGGFGSDDYAPGIDQAFWFVFDQPVTGGYFRFAETTNLDSYSEMLEIDFVGVTSVPTRVPEPSTLLLLGSSLLGLPLLRRIRVR